MDLPGLGNVDLVSTVYTYAGVGAWLIGILIVLAGAALVYYKVQKGEWFGKFPVSIFIWEVRGGKPMRTAQDKARAIKDKSGAWFYELKKKKIQTRAIPFEYINPDGSIDLLALGRDEYHPIQILSEKATVITTNGEKKEIDVPNLRPVIDEGFAVGYAYRTHKNYARKPNDGFWNTYGGMITVIGIGMITMLILFVVLREMGAITNSLAGTAASFAEVSMKLATCGTPPPAVVAP